MPAETVLSHRSAAQLWGLWIPPFTGIEVCTPATARGGAYTTSVQRDRVVAHRHKLPEEQVTTRFGQRVSTLEQTWVHLAPLLDTYDLIAAGDRVLALGGSAEALAELVASSARARGIANARQALPHLDGRSRSRPESRIRGAIVLAGLPKPEVNRAIHDEHGQWLAEPDLHYKEAKLAFEYNGKDHAEFEQMTKDSIRAIDLDREGWKVRVYTSPYAFRRIDDVGPDVLRLLTERAPAMITRAARLRVTRMGRTRPRVSPSLGA